MNITATLKIVATFFIIVTAVLLVMLVMDVTDSQAVKDAIVKSALLSAIVAGTSIGISFLNKK